MYHWCQKYSNLFHPILISSSCRTMHNEKHWRTSCEFAFSWVLLRKELALTVSNMFQILCFMLMLLHRNLVLNVSYLRNIILRLREISKSYPTPWLMQLLQQLLLSVYSVNISRWTSTVLNTHQHLSKESSVRCRSSGFHIRMSMYVFIWVSYLSFK